MINKLRQLGDTPLATRVIVRGELIFMAQKSEQKVQNLHQVHQFLNDILVYPIDDQTANIFEHFLRRQNPQRHSQWAIKW